MEEYLLETTSGDWFLGLEFQLDCKLTEGNLQRCIRNKGHVTAKSQTKGCLTTSTFGKIVISISCDADVIELLQALLL
jgi:hypothetical protein